MKLVEVGEFNLRPRRLMTSGTTRNLVGKVVIYQPMYVQDDGEIEEISDGHAVMVIKDDGGPQVEVTDIFGNNFMLERSKINRVNSNDTSFRYMWPVTPKTGPIKDLPDAP